MTTVAEMTLASVLDGGHPFIQPAAEFSAATAGDAEFCAHR